MSSLQPVRGTQSLLGEDADRLHEVIAAFDRVRRLYGFKRAEVPVIEHTSVFARTIGVIMAFISALAGFAWLPYAPVWGVIFIAIAVSVIWALTVHGRDVVSDY